MNRILLITVGVLALAGVVLGALSFSKISGVDSRLSTMEEAYSTVETTVTIDYGGVKEKESHDLVLAAGTSPLDALNRVAKVNVVEGEAEGEEEAPRFLEINGVSRVSHNAEDRSWRLYLGEMALPVGYATQVSVQEGVEVVFKFEEAATQPTEGEEGGLSIEGGNSTEAQ